MDERVATYVPLTRPNNNCLRCMLTPHLQRVRDSCEERGRRLMTWFLPRFPCWPVWAFSPETYAHRLAVWLVFLVISYVLPNWLSACLFPAAGRWRWIAATARANTFVYALGHVATYNRMLCVGLFWPIVCFPTVGEIVAVSLGLACSLIHLPH